MGGAAERSRVYGRSSGPGLAKPESALTTACRRLGLRAGLRCASASRSAKRLKRNVRQHANSMMVLAIGAEDRMPLQPRLAGRSLQAKRCCPRFTRGASAKRSSSQALVGRPFGAVARSSDQSVCGAAWRRHLLPTLAARGSEPGNRRLLRASPLAHLRLLSKPAGTAASVFAGSTAPPIQCCLTLRWSGTSTGMALGPRAVVVHHPSRGPSATPASAPQLKR